MSDAYMPVDMIEGLKLCDPDLAKVGRVYVEATWKHDSFHLLNLPLPALHTHLVEREEQARECLRRRLIGYLN